MWLKMQPEMHQVEQEIGNYSKEDNKYWLIGKHATHAYTNTYTQRGF